MSTALTLPQAHRSRTVIGLLLALLVQGLFLVLLRLGPPTHGTRASTLLEFRLLADEPRNQENRPAPATKPPHHFGLPPNRGDSVDLPKVKPSESGPVPATATEPTTATQAALPKPAPLNLTLPAQRAASGPRPQSMLEQMLNDPRSNSPKRTLESAIADAAGTLPQVSSTSTDGQGSTLIRRGSKCYRVTPSRMQTVDPMNDRLKGLPAEWGKCTN